MMQRDKFYSFRNLVIQEFAALINEVVKAFIIIALV